MKTGFLIDSSTCKSCGSCMDVCPNRIIQKDETGEMIFREDRLWMCFSCGQCMAVCPTGSVHIPGLSYEKDFFPVEKASGAEYKQFSHLIDSRRAMRCFKQKPVPQELLQKIVDAIRSAPPSFPPLKTELVVVQNTEVIRRALPIMIDIYDGLVKAMKNPIARIFVRGNAGAEAYKTLKSHVIPLLEERLPDLKAGREDTLMRWAPALILFHANRNSENYRTDIHIAATYGILAAHALGLGATILDLVPPAINRSRELREMFHIPVENEVAASMILGYPKHTFRLGIRRELKSVEWL